jgi:hypothetical protein
VKRACLALRDKLSTSRLAAAMLRDGDVDALTEVAVASPRASGHRAVPGFAVPPHSARSW